MNIIADRLKELRDKFSYSQEAFVSRGVTQKTISNWEKGDTPAAFDWLKTLAVGYETSADYVLGLTADVAPKPKRELSPDEHSILDIMRELPTHKREEVIQLAEVVLRMYRKEEIEDSKSSLMSVAKEKYESGENAPRIIGQDPNDPQDSE